MRRLCQFIGAVGGEVLVAERLDRREAQIYRLTLMISLFGIACEFFIVNEQRDALGR